MQKLFIIILSTVSELQLRLLELSRRLVASELQLPRGVTPGRVTDNKAAIK
jgi:hypothetical protein